jgi:protein-S-isoprenylcysteine O-methyltransferase Ste14
MSSLHFAWRGRISAALFLALALSRFLSDAPLRPEWLILAAAGAAWRLWAARHIPAHSNGASLGGDVPATGGPYAVSRHPLYLSNLAVALGLVLFANSLPSWGAAALLAATAAHYALLARAEERFLLARLGESYASYLRAVPRWPWPVRRPAPPEAEAGRADSWGAALARQAGNLGKACACALFLWGLSVHG